MTMTRINTIVKKKARFIFDGREKIVMHILWERQFLKAYIAPTAPLAASTQTSQLKNPVAPAAEGLPILAPLALANLLT